MSPTTPRQPHSTPSEAPAPVQEGFSFCLWWGSAGPPQVVGHSAEDAGKRLFDFLVHFFAHLADPPSRFPHNRAREALPRQQDLGLTVHYAPDERSAFLVYVRMSCLTPSEALLRWREAFPTAAEPDPLQATVEALNSMRAVAGPPAPGRSNRLLARRYHLLGRVGDKLPRFSEPRLKELSRPFDGPTR